MVRRGHDHQYTGRPEVCCMSFVDEYRAYSIGTVTGAVVTSKMVLVADARDVAAVVDEADIIMTITTGNATGTAIAGVHVMKTMVLIAAMITLDLLEVEGTEARQFLEDQASTARLLRSLSTTSL
jgi:uncharacterized membrane protein YcaP (DUF421 family)